MIEGWKPILKSRWTRSLKLLLSGSGTAVRLLNAKVGQLLFNDKEGTAAVDAVTAEIVEQLVESLGQLKGLAAKAGQIASFMDFAIPQAAKGVLQKLQDAIPPMPGSAVRQIFLEEFGRPPDKLFHDWSDKPFAAASIGQVHQARLPNGTDVAVKVQYPGIKTAIQADLANVELLDQIGTLLFRSQERGVFSAELAEHALAECDYLQEADNQEAFRKIWADDPDLIIPEVFREFSTQRVLTTQYCHGKRFYEFVDSAGQAERNHAGTTIWRFAFRSTFVHQIFNADPHPGNYLFHDGKVIFLDFGSVKRFEPAFMSEWLALIRAMLERNRERFKIGLQRLRLGKALTEADVDYLFHEGVYHLYEPWLNDRPFRYRPEFVAGIWSNLFVNNPAKFRMNTPREFVLINRIHFGIFSLLALMGTEANWRRLFLPLIYSDSASNSEAV